MPRHPQNAWAREDIVDELIRLKKDNESCSEIAAILNKKYSIFLTRNSVIGKLNRLGFSEKKEQVEFARRINAVRIEKRLAPKKTNISGLTGVRRGISFVKGPPRPIEEEIPAVDNGFGRLNLTATTAQTCMFPYGDSPPYLYCGEATKKDRDGIPSSSYCLLHHNRMHIPPIKRQQRAWR